MPTFFLRPRGAFSLAAAAQFAERFPGTQADRSADELRFSWAIDRHWSTVHVRLHEAHGIVHGQLDGQAADDVVDLARRDVERILCLDVDARPFTALGERDPVVGALQRRFCGLRPVLFFTPYEAAAWTIIGQRIRITQAAAIKERLAAQLGDEGAFPAPHALAALSAPQRGLTDRKIHQLRELGAAALDDRLSREHLRALPTAEASRQLQELPGIGPFSSELILVRGVGDPDALPTREERLARATRAAYELPDHAELATIADGWRPYRAWVAFLLRTWHESETREIATGRRMHRAPRLAPA